MARRSTRPRDWSDVAGKRANARWCAYCGRSDRKLDAAHLIGRARDGPSVHPDEVAFLCGPFPHGCHGRYDRGELDLYPRLDAAELAGAVRAAGDPGLALRRLSAPLWRAPALAPILDARLRELEALCLTDDSRT